MKAKNQKPGAKKGVPKPLAREVDPAFPARLRQVMGVLTDAQLARDVGASRAVIGQYLNGRKKRPEALLIFAIADRLGVSPRWLLTGKPDKPVRNSTAQGVLEKV